MTKENRAAGIGGVAFGVLFFAAMMIANGPGGNYSASEVTAFNASGHRLAVFVALYAALFACGGLVALLAGLRGTIPAPAPAPAPGTQARSFGAAALQAPPPWRSGGRSYRRSQCR